VINTGTTLTAVFSNANGETAAVTHDGTGGATPVAITTTLPTGNLTPVGSRTYTLTVTNSADTPATATATVTVNVVPVVLSVSYGLKQLQFSWTDVSADHYKLWEDPDGPGALPLAQVGSNLTATSYNHDVSVHLKGNATYYVQACDVSDVCGDSNTVDVTGAIVAAIGYVKGGDTDGSDQFGHGVALSSDGSTLAVGARTEGDGQGAVYVFINSGGTWQQQTKIKPDVVVDANDFGARVALSGDGNTLAIGSYGDDTAANGIWPDTQTHDCLGAATSCALDSGAAYVYTRDGSGVWTREAYIKPSNTGAGDGFGWALGLSHDGNTLAVSSPFESSNANNLEGQTTPALQIDDCTAPAPSNCAVNSGATYVFNRAGTTWTQQAYIKSANNTAAGAGVFGFGVHIALNGADGNTLAVGAPHENGTFGRAYVYIRTGTTWASGIGITPNTGAGGAFGSAIAVSDDGGILAVGAQGESSIADSNGAAYIFTSSSGWSEQAFLTASNAGTGDWFGYSIAISGDGSLLVVGADQESGAATGINGNQADDTAPSAGAAYVFTNSGGTWPQKAYVKASNTQTDTWFGRNIALSDNGGVMAVGSRFEDSAAQGIGGNQVYDCGTSVNCAGDAGAVYLY